MTARLPVPGSDDNVWGDLLNAYLGVSLASDGTVNSGVITTTQIADGTITTTDISASAAIARTQLSTGVQSSLASADSSVQTSGAQTVAGTKTFSSVVAANGGIQIGTSSTSGQVWTASDTAGNGSWQTSAAGGARSVQLISASITAAAVASTDYIYYWNGSTAWTLTMPTAVSNTDRYTIKNSGSISQTVATSSSQTIEGTSTITVRPNVSVDLISNGANWMVI